MSKNRKLAEVEQRNKLEQSASSLLNRLSEIGVLATKDSIAAKNALEATMKALEAYKDDHVCPGCNVHVEV